MQSLVMHCAQSCSSCSTASSCCKLAGAMAGAHVAIEHVIASHQLVRAVYVDRSCTMSTLAEVECVNVGVQVW